MKAATFHQTKHLDPTQLMDRTDQCPICLSITPREVVHRIQRDPDVDMLHCLVCRGCSASHMPTPKYLENYYGSYYQGKDMGVSFPMPEKFARNILNAVQWRAFPREVRLLDFGGGDGTLALTIARHIVRSDPTREVHIVLVDYQKPAVSEEPNISISHCVPTDRFDGHAHLVIASAILEHIPDVNEVLRKLFAVLAHGGYFYARTPYVIPFTRLFKSLDLTFPAHVHDMGSGFWNRVLGVFKLDGRCVASRPSIVESRFREDFIRTLAAHALKFPSRAECMLSPARRMDRFWNLVGGWEIVLKLRKTI